MPTEIRMQKLSDTMEVGTLLKWHKKPGDTVEFDDELADVETDKATMALTAPEGGILHAIYVEEGAKVPVGSPVALILEEGEEPPAEGSVPAPAAAAAALPQPRLPELGEKPPHRQQVSHHQPVKIVVNGSKLLRWRARSLPRKASIYAP